MQPSTQQNLKCLNPQKKERKSIQQQACLVSTVHKLTYGTVTATLLPPLRTSRVDSSESLQTAVDEESSREEADSSTMKIGLVEAKNGVRGSTTGSVEAEEIDLGTSRAVVAGMIFTLTPLGRSSGESTRMLVWKSALKY